ncbi:unnamed protein product, partial [Oncorhynchus mykiss]
GGNHLPLSLILSPPHPPPPPSPSSSLSELKQELDEEGSRCSLLSRQHRFNERCCIRCCSPFTFLVNPKRPCLDCKYNVCKTCRSYSKKDKAWVCSACQKGRSVGMEECVILCTGIGGDESGRRCRRMVDWR